jgi:8-oxo-dGTP diphosphatase
MSLVKVIHKIAAMVIKDNTFLMVRKADHETWTTLGGKPEAGETEEVALLREIKEEVDCDATIIRKLGDFEAEAADDDAIVKLSVYLTDVHGEMRIIDPELAEYRFIGSDYETQGIKLTKVFRTFVLPFCLKEGLLSW